MKVKKYMWGNSFSSRIVFCASLLFLLGITTGKAQRNVAVGTPFTQNFNGLAGGAFKDNTTLTGWYLSSGSLTQSNGSSGTDGAYVFRSGGGHGALGGVGSGTSFGLRVRNNSGSTVQCVRVSYTGEQWRVGESGGAVGTLDFAYSTGSTVTSLSGGFTTVGGASPSPHRRPTPRVVPVAPHWTAICPPIKGRYRTSSPGSTSPQAKKSCCAGPPKAPAPAPAMALAWMA